MIKKWFEYINESEDADGYANYPFNEHTITDFFLIFEDNYYSVDVSFGGYYDNIFLDYRGILNTGIRISIKKSKDTPKINLTSEFKKIISRIFNSLKRKYDDGFSFFYKIGSGYYSSDVTYDINKVHINGGFIKGNYTSEYDTVNEYLGVNIILPIASEFNTPLKIFKHYRLTGQRDENNVDDVKIEGEKVFYIISNSDLADKIVHYKSSYKEYLTSDDDISLEVSYERIDTSMLLKYHLSNDNLRLFLKLVLKKDMFAEFKEAYIEYNGIDEELNGLNDDEVIDYMVKDQTYLDEILDEQEPCEDIISEIKDTYHRLECSEYESEYYKEVQYSFEKKIEKEFLNGCASFSTDHGLYWSIPFTREWLVDISDERFEGGTIDCAFTEYLDVSNPQIELNPYFPDYVPINDNEFNDIVKVIIENAF